MLMTPRPEPVAVPAEVLEEVRELYARGLCMQAYLRAQSVGPLAAWTGTAARLLAGRLAIHLGSPRLTFWHHLHAWRKEPADPEACYYHARALLERRGPLRTWEFLRRQRDLSEAAAPVRADWLGFHACVLGRLRDFDAAEDWLSRAEALAPARPWLCIERSILLETEDRYEESLEAARLALRFQPWYRPGVQSAAHILQLLDRDQEALELLTEAVGRLESGLVVAQLALLQTELGHYQDAQRSYERLAELSPLLDKDMGRWLAARRSDAAYYAGDLAAAAVRAREVEGEPFYAGLAERLEKADGEGKRVLLPVGFVRQHHKTCAPATLAAVSRFWEMPAEHLEIAGEICYDGTPAHSERRWAEEHGWTAREFRVTREVARALLDRGLPFTLTMTEATFGHLQAAIGYDSRRDTLLVRDPYQRYFGEYATDAFLQRYQATGPRGMVLVPAERAAMLDGIELTDAVLYDHFYRLLQALQEHRRDEARQAKEDLLAAAPGHRLAWEARRVLALYDANPTELLTAVEGLLRLYPEDGALQLHKTSCLRELARREECLAFLKGLCEKPGCDPVFWQLYAQELVPDARQHPEVVRLLRRYLRVRPGDARGYAALAGVLWAQRRFEPALELYRWAACLEDKDEGLAQSYFQAARPLRQTDAALAFLRDRFTRFGDRSGQPARTLSWALSQLGDATAANDILDKALALRPDDGDLLLYAAQVYASSGNLERGATLLAAAEPRCRRTSWLRAAANLALFRSELAEALRLWRGVLEVEPLALEAHREAARLLAETEGRAAALDHLRQACARFPHHYQLHFLLVQWLQEDGPAEAEPVVRHILESHPTDAWGHRELALILTDTGRLEEAAAELRIAEGLEPASPSHFTVLAHLCAVTGQIEESKEAYRQAIRLSVDNGFAIAELIAACDSHAERREALTFVEQELVKQVVFGDGLLTFREQARFTLNPEELLASLQAGLTARPDLWHAWSAVIRQLADMGRLDEALDLARQATARFPLLPALWLDLAVVCKARQDKEGEAEALGHALQINPAWAVAARQLADLQRRQGKVAEAKATLEDAIRRTPLDCITYGWLAEVLWKLGEKEAALERVQEALRLAPGYNWAWGALRSWSQALGKPEIGTEFARDLAQRRGGEARSWLMLARTLGRPEDLDERLAALDRALALNARLADAHDLKAELLAGAGRFDEAIAACQAPVWAGRPPLILRGRVAWIEAQRGNVAEAISRMRAVVAEDSEYYWGWEQLASWVRDRGTAAEYLEAAQMLVRLAPDDAMSLGYLGEAQLRSGNRAAGKTTYRRALELAPAYTFAGQALFDAQLDDEELDDAAQTLAILETHSAGPQVLARAVQLAVRRKDRESACKGLAELCVSAEANGWPLDSAARALLSAGWADDAEQVFAEALDSPQVQPHVATLWVDRWAARGDWKQARRVEELLSRGAVGDAALNAYLRALGQAKRAGDIRRCLEHHRDRLRASTFAWGTAGYALVTISDYRGTIAWLEDYSSLPNVMPWMLTNLLFALRALGREEEAVQVSRDALTLSPDYTTPYHRVWVAAEELLASASTAGDPVAGIEAGSLDGTHRFVYELARAMQLLRSTPQQARRQVFHEIRRALAEQARTNKPMSEDLPAVRRIYRRCIRRIAEDVGGLRATLWAGWRQLFPLLPKV
jgi:tetratricopeptide (TPR) repeat protein